MNGNRVGQELGVYQLTRLLGKGGFGEVYEADHRLLEQKRAIKLLREDRFHDPHQHERFLREARTLATLDHPNIVPLLEVGEEGNILYLVMPFYRRGTLHDLLKKRTVPLSFPEVKRFLEQICAAVGYAHTQHIAHLDLKPQNLLLHDDGRLVVSDFGLAHIIQQGQLVGGSSLGLGTPHYMAPEQIRGRPELRSDLYSLGIILYQLLTNQLPFTGNIAIDVAMKHIQEAPPRLRTVSPALPEALESVVRNALEKKPENRYATAEALLADFHGAVSSSTQQPAQLSGSGESTPEPKPRRVDQTEASGLLPGAIPAPPVFPAPLTATQPARGAPLTPSFTQAQRNFSVSSIYVAPPGGIKQKKLYATKQEKPSKMSGGFIFLLTLLLGVGWVWLFPPAVSLIFSFDHHVACNNPLPGIVGALSALLFYACIIAVLFAAPIGLSALIVGFIKKIAHYEHVDEMIFGARALAITIIAVIIIIFIMWFLLTCGFS